MSGVGVYSREILHGLASLRGGDEFGFYYRPHRYTKALRLRLPSNCTRHLLWEGRASASFDVFHGMNQRLPSANWKRKVATFHDLFVLTSDYSTAEFRQRFASRAREAAERADLVIAVSEFTAAQVHELLRVETSRIRVVPHGVHQPAGQPPVERKRVVLHVGAIQHRKNVSRLVEAFERCPTGWRLVLAGSTGFGAQEILDRINASNRRSDIDVMGYVADDALRELYASSSILAFPSLDEGFGIPILEAMARGLPVLTSDRSALPEVSGDAAVLVDPLEVDSIEEGLQKLMVDGELRDDLRQRGLDRAREYPWDQAARRTWLVYEELLG